MKKENYKWDVSIILRLSEPKISGEIGIDFQWKYEFCRDILAQVLELTLTAELPSYQTILDLDRKVREKTLPAHLNVFMSAEDEHCTPAAYMRRCNLGQYRSVSEYMFFFFEIN